VSNRDAAAGAGRPAALDAKAWGIGVVAFAAVVRFLLWLTYEPIAYGDTGTYMRLAEVLQRLSLRAYDGTRTPGYPAFLALAGRDPTAAWLAQMALGLLITFGLFWVAWRLTGNAPLAAGVAALYSLLPGQLYFEAALLTETLTTFFIVACLVALTALRQARSPAASALLAFALGLSASLAGLTRPLFFILPAVLLPFVWTAGTKGIGNWGWRMGLYCLPPLILLGGWLGFIRSQYGMLSPTVMGGYSLVQHTGRYFELLPEEDAAIRDTYLRYRDVRLAERGNQTNAIWDAIPELSRVSGLGFYDLSREMQRLSLGLIRQHPDLYASDVASGWVAFWKAPVFMEAGAISPEGLRPALVAYGQLSRWFVMTVNAVFLVLCALAVFVPHIRRAVGAQPVILASIAMVLTTSVVQTLLDHGDNPRFLVPLQMVVILVVFVTLGPSGIIRTPRKASYS
jgi:hypothetical protein